MVLSFGCAPSQEPFNDAEAIHRATYALKQDSAYSAILDTLQAANLPEKPPNFHAAAAYLDGVLAAHRLGLSDKAEAMNRKAMLHFPALPDSIAIDHVERFARVLLLNGQALGDLARVNEAAALYERNIVHAKRRGDTLGVLTLAGCLSRAHAVRDSLRAVRGHLAHRPAPVRALLYAALFILVAFRGFRAYLRYARPLPRGIR